MSPTTSYLGVDRHRFNKEIRPFLTEIPIGIQGIAFDRLDLDVWVDHYKQRSGRLAASNYRSLDIWDENERRVSINVEMPGTSTRKSSDFDFAKALELVSLKKPKVLSKTI